MQSSELLGKTIAQALGSKVRAGFSGIQSSDNFTLTYMTSESSHLTDSEMYRVSLARQSDRMWPSLLCRCKRIQTSEQWLHRTLQARYWPVNMVLTA